MNKHVSRAVLEQNNYLNYQRQTSRYLATYDKRWRAIREQVLSTEPLCRNCALSNKTVEAIDVDHINGRADRPKDYEIANLQPLCRSCHSTKTQKERTQDEKPRRNPTL